MISLDGVAKLEVVMAGAPAATQPTFYASFALTEDVNKTFDRIDNTTGSLSSGTPVDVVPAVGAGILRHDVRDLTIFNIDSQDNVITVRIDKSGSKFNIFIGTVPFGGSVSLENSSGRFTIYDAFGLVLTGTPPTGPTPVEALIGIKTTFQFDTTSPLDFGVLAIGDQIVEAEVTISTPFDDASALLALGQSSNPGNILPTNAIDATVVGTYHSGENFLMSGADSIRLNITPGTSTVGSGRVIVTVKEA